MTANLTTADSILKEFYLPGVQEQLNNMHVLLKMVESSSRMVEGRRAIVAVHTSRNSGVGGAAEGGTLPTAGSQGYAEERVPIIYNFARGEITDQTIEATASDKGSFHRQLAAEMDGLVTDAKNNYSRQLYNDSTKTLAQLGTTTASATLVLAADTTATELRLLEQGGLIDVGTAGDPDSVVSGAVIQSVDVANKTVTIDSAITTSASHFITRSGTQRLYEITGIREIIEDSGTLFNIDPTVETVWKSFVDDNGGTNRPVTERLLTNAMEQVFIKSGKTPNLAMADYGTRAAIVELMDSRRRFTNTVEVTPGFSAVTVSAGNYELPIVVDNFAPSNQVNIVNTAHLHHHVMGKPWSWMDRDGSVLSRVANKANYEFTLRCYSELTTDRRNAHAAVRDLTGA